MLFVSMSVWRLIIHTGLRVLNKKQVLTSFVSSYFHLCIPSRALTNVYASSFTLFNSKIKHMIPCNMRSMTDLIPRTKILQWKSWSVNLQGFRKDVPLVSADDKMCSAQLTKRLRLLALLTNYNVCQKLPSKFSDICRTSKNSMYLWYIPSQILSI